MKLPICTRSLAVLACISITPAFAVVNIDYVPVGYAGNSADYTTLAPYGAVNYVFQIGKYEVSNAQYTEFLNAVDPNGANANGIYNTNMGSDARGGITYTSGAGSGAKYTVRTSMGDKPVNFVSWYDAARFANWLQNGQGAGSTETGAYTLDGNTGMITKNVSATVWLPSDDEWHKAAYYDPTPGASGDNYWLYPTQSDTVPTVATANATGDIFNPGANVANFNDGADWNSLNGNLTTVGSAGANNYFGTADQGGNVAEWTDKVFFDMYRGLRGGYWSNNEFGLTATTVGTALEPDLELGFVGFRVAGVPEPSAMLLTLLTSVAFLFRRTR